MLCAITHIALSPREVGAQTSDGAARTSRLALGFAVDTAAVPSSWWGVDPAFAARSAVVRFWRDYLAVRSNRDQRVAFWSAADRRRMPDPDLALASANYIGSADALLIEALPLVAGDSSRWVLRTMYVGSGTAARPGLLALERVHVVREGTRWALVHPNAVETASWRRERVGALVYVVHPALRYDAARAAETARWVDTTARRFGIMNPAPITYYQLPDLEAAYRVMGLDWALSAERVGGRANPSARIVFAADPRFGEAYRHEIAHVLLAPWIGDASPFVSEGIAYWLGGARGQPFDAMMRDLAAFVTQHPGVELRNILETQQSSAVASAELPAAAAVFELAHRQGGDAAVRRLVNAARRGRPSVELLAGALDMTPQALSRQWRALVLSYAGPAAR